MRFLLGGKRKGSAVLTLTIATAAMISAIALSLVKKNSATDFTLRTNNIKNQALQYAYAEINLARVVRYSELPSYYRREGDTEVIYEYNPVSGVFDEDSGYRKKVSLGDETVYRRSSYVTANNVNQRIVNVKIFHKDYSYTLINTDVPRYSRERNPYVPVGTIIAWAGRGTPSEEYGRWLECKDRVGCILYQQLTKVLGRKGNTVDFVPNMNGISLKGVAYNSQETGRTETVLPDIVGGFVMPNALYVPVGGLSFNRSGAFYFPGTTSSQSKGMLQLSSGKLNILESSTIPHDYIAFSASSCNNIYSGSRGTTGDGGFTLGNFATTFLIKADDK